MKVGKKTRLGLAVVFLIGTLVSVSWRFINSSPEKEPPKFFVPVLSAVAEAGQMAFATNCAACHGINGVGTDKGPPLIHRIYRPGHHADFAFQQAVRLGVRAHHWRFGNMPPQPQLTREETASIIRFIREVQKANNIN
jgi:cytochrome c